MRQLSNTLRKDFEHLWPYCLVFLSLIGMHAWQVTHVESGTGIAISGLRSVLWLVAGLSQILLPIALLVIVVLLVQEEALVGSNAFWLTRPYSRNVLLIEKALFLLLLVFVPMLIHDLFVVGWFSLSTSGLPSLIAVKDVELVGLLICTAAFAVLTRTFGRFTLFALGSFVAFSLLALALSPYNQRVGGPLSNVSNWLAWTLASFGALIVVLHQYRTRRTKVSSIIWATAVTGAVIVASLFPWTAAWNLGKRFGAPASASKQVQLVPTADAHSVGVPTPSAEIGDNPPFHTILYPFQTTGLPNDISLDLFQSRSEIRAGSVTLPFVMPSGTVFHNDPIKGFPESSGARRDVQLVTMGTVDSHVFERLRDSKISLAGTLYFVVYHDLKLVRVPASNHATSITIGQQRCMVHSFQGLDPTSRRQVIVTLTCTELEPPSGIRYEFSLVDGAGEPVSRGGSRSETNAETPFAMPALLSPVHQSQVQATFNGFDTKGPSSVLRDATVIIYAREAICFLRRDFVINDVRLRDIDTHSWMQRQGIYTQ